MTVDYKDVAKEWYSQKPSGRSNGKSFWLAVRVAIEKQIPMKVKEIHCDEYYCPACGSENNCSDIRTVGDKFCPECGQALET